MPAISILVAVLNPPELTANFLHCLSDDLRDGDIELVVVCDGDSNPTTHHLLRDAEIRAPHVKVIFLERSVGYGVANNVAAREAKGEILVFLNSDTFPKRGAIRRLASFIRSNADVGVAQGLLIYPQTLRVQSSGHIFGPFFNKHALAGRHASIGIVNRAADRQALTSAFYAVRRTLFYRNGGFDEFYLNSFEAMEFALRMHLKGYRCAYRPDAIAYHVQGSSRRRLSIDEAQQAARFWSKWGRRIKRDLDHLLGLQITPKQKKKNYIVVDASTNRCWKETLETVGLKGEKVAAVTVTGQSLILQETLAPDIHQCSSPILFLMDEFTQLEENLPWFSRRFQKLGLVLDCHGNVVTIPELASYLPYAVVDP